MLNTRPPVLSLLGFILVGAVACSTPDAEKVSPTSPEFTRGGDRTAPTAPSNLRSTGTTVGSVSLAWNPSTDNSSFSYRVRHSWGYEATVPSSQTSYTWTGHLDAGYSYSFWVYAVDAAGNTSKNSNTITVKIPSDKQAPTAPVLSLVEAGPTHATLSWHSTDDGPFIFYDVFKNGVAVIQGVSATSGAIRLLEPSTTYSFTAKARDNGINWSPLSEPLTVTTPAADPNDKTPPTAPTNVRADNYDEEINVSWGASTDNVTQPAFIRYDVFVNGVLQATQAGQAATIVYGQVGQNTISVFATDEAGNKSAAGTTTIVIR